MLSLTSFRSEKQGLDPAQKGFDDFQISLGDLMRGERATMGKSLMDVQRELKIKAAYIAAVEDADPSVFDTPGFIAGYVRSYAKYLGMDSQMAFDKFCAESGFAPIHGMSEKALPMRMAREDRLKAGGLKPIGALGASATPFVPPSEHFFSRIDIKALVSSVVLICLVGGLGYGAYQVMQEVQQVKMTPIEQPPMVISDLDPLAPRAGTGDDMAQLTTPSQDAFDRLYRPQALDAPILVPRDGPIANLNPDGQGAFVPSQPTLTIENDLAALSQPDVQVLQQGPEVVTLVADDGVWLRVRDADGAVVLEKILNAGDTFEVPTGTDPALIERAGNSGALFFVIGNEMWGPAGAKGSLAKNIVLSPEAIRDTYSVFVPSEDQSSLFSFFNQVVAGSDTQ